MNKLLNLLTSEIKMKSQISYLENDYVESKLNQYLLTNGSIRKKLEEEFNLKQNKIVKSKLFKQIVKDIRQEIGQVYGQFLTNKNSKKYKILDKGELDELLELHKSTRERKDYYEKIYSNIFSWYKPSYVLDLACGYNPCSYNLMKIKPKYLAIDLNSEDMKFLTSFFEKFKINGVAKNYDVTSLDFLNDLEIKKCDLVFLFKALDSFEEVKKNFSKELLEKLPQKNIIVSFPTKSLVSKSDFKNVRKGWLRKIIDKNKWKYETFEVENEIFFLINKS